MSTVQKLITVQTIEDYLVYLVPVFVALAGFNWASLIPGDNNAFLTGIIFGFLAKLLVGIQQDGWDSWQDWIPTALIVFTFLATALSSNPNYLYYGSVCGFIVKALGYFQKDPTTGKYPNPTEDILLAVGAFLTLYGLYIGNADIANSGALLSLIGKTVPSIGATLSSTSAAPAVSTGA